MAKWTITDGPHADGPLFEIVTTADGTITLHIPSPDPVAVSRAKVEEIRTAMGAALGEDEPS